MTTITITRIVPAGPEQAFDAWIDAEQLAQWWWPQWPDTTYELDAHNGGAYKIRSEKMGIGVTGTFIEVDRPRTLAMTWIWDGDDGQPVDVVDKVVVTFEPVDDGTKVTVRHESTEHLSEGGAEQGWNDVLDRLPAHCAQWADA